MQKNGRNVDEFPPPLKRWESFAIYLEEPTIKYDDFSGVTAREYSEEELLKIFTRIKIRQLWG